MFCVCMLREHLEGDGTQQDTRSLEPVRDIVWRWFPVMRMMARQFAQPDPFCLSGQALDEQTLLVAISRGVAFEVGTLVHVCFGPELQPTHCLSRVDCVACGAL